MKLEFHQGLQDANKVLTKLRVALKQVKKVPHTDFRVESYVNCREQGYAIIGYCGTGVNEGREFYCSFSQHRNSDSVVVHLGTKLLSTHRSLYQSFCGNIAEEVVYANRQTFQWTKDGAQYREAATFIAIQIGIFLSDKFTQSKYYIKS